MRNIKLGLSGLLMGLSLLWWAAIGEVPDALNFITVRNYFVQYSGIIAIGVFSVAMVLATRPRWIEPFAGGLDKSYRLHKWLGIGGGVTAIFHWLGANGPKWLVGWGVIERPRRGPRADPETLGAIQRFLGDQREMAEAIGEWAFYAVVLLIAVALIKRIPYRLFAATHRLIAVAYLALVFHSVMLINFSYWMQPIGIVSGLLMLAGVLAALLSLGGRIGRTRQVQGTIEALHYFPDMRIQETVIKLDPDWPGHDGGQFAFVTFDAGEGQHPFTIASAWNPADRRVMFITKALGDYTEYLPDRLRIGDPVTVEGPYGRFTFEDGHERQIWIGGGVGITPFIARMKQLAQAPEDQLIDLFHSTTNLEPAALEKLTADAAGANVNLHVLINDRDGYLTGEKLREAVPDWRSAGIWFCGPAGFGAALRQDLTAHGLSANDFHQELFDMR